MCFLEVNYSLKETKDLSVAKTLFSLTLPKKLHETMNIRKGCIRLQVLDYEGLPFRCRRCHKYGHLVQNCTLPFKNPSCLEQPIKKQKIDGVGLGEEGIFPSEEGATSNFQASLGSTVPSTMLTTFVVSPPMDSGSVPMTTTFS